VLTLAGQVYSVCIGDTSSSDNNTVVEITTVTIEVACSCCSGSIKVEYAYLVQKCRRADY